MLKRYSGLIVLFCGLALSASGCRKHTVQAAPPVVVPPAPEEPRPPTPPPATPPETKPEPAPAAPLPKAPAAKPPTSAPRPAPEPPLPRPAPLIISPRLSAAEQAEYQHKTNEAIAVGEKNLQVAYGKQLTAAQHDLVEKIRGFLAQAREAIRASDWVRAYNLAQKAQVLSVELVNSL